MWNRKWVRITLISLAGALILGLSAYSIVLHDQNISLNNQISAVYQRSFEELMTDMNSLQTKLYKLEAATGLNQYSMLLTDVWRQTGDTAGSLSALPVSYAGTSTLTQFINRTGDFCRSLLRKLSLGQSITQEEYDQIKKLAASCGEIIKPPGTTRAIRKTVSRCHIHTRKR